MTRDLNTCLSVARDVARHASDRIAELYEAYRAGGDAGTVHKEGDGPVTAADRAANDIIMSELRAAFPDDALLSEENPESWITRGEWTWMVDPLDGTEEYIKANGEFMVMIGLCHSGVPVVGVVREPATGDELYAVRGGGAWRVAPGETEPVRIQVSQQREIESLVLAVSRSHRSPRVESFTQQLNMTGEFISGSVGRKIALVTTGKADVYLHPSPGTKMWDSCAPQVILEEAGGVFTNALGEPISYARADGDVKNDQGLLAANPFVFDRLVEASRKAWEIPLPERAPKKK